MSDNNNWEMDPRDALRVGEGFDLSAMDRRATPGWDGNKADGKEHMTGRANLLSELQERLYAEGRSGGKRSVLIIVQGLDTAGKGGVARHVMGMVDPQGVQLHAFKAPTEEELKQHYLERVRKQLPEPGKIGLFDRSHYEDVLPVRVDNLVPQKVWEKRYEEINDFERELVANGTHLLKFAMMVSHEEQGQRLMRRLARPDKYWKYSPGDLETRAKWDAYQEAYQAVFDLTSTDHAPWYVLPADRKWYPRLAITEILTRTLVEMDLGWPKPRWRAETQRRNVAKTMSTEALKAAYDETETEIEEAAADLIEVREDVAYILEQGGADPKVLEARIQAKRDELSAHLEQTLAHTRELLNAREDGAAPKPSKTEKKLAAAQEAEDKDAKKSKNSKGKKKSKKKDKKK